MDKAAYEQIPKTIPVRLVEVQVFKGGRSRGNRGSGTPARGMVVRGGRDFKPKNCATCEHQCYSELFVRPVPSFPSRKSVMSVRRECVCILAGASPAWEGSLAQ